MDRELIEQYAAGAEKLSLAIRGLTAQDLRCPTDPKWNAGKWSINQVVNHVADCEQVYADRMKWAISEDNPPLPGFDQDKWAAALHYDDQSAEDAAKLVELTRKQMSTILRKLPDNVLNRTGHHSERGPMKVIDLLQYMVTHLDHHIQFIHAKRAAMGKEMW